VICTYGVNVIGDNKGTSKNRAGGDSTIPADSDLIIKPSDLLPGDVLLYRPGKEKIHQRKISEATGSPYTHAAIYLGDGLVAESNFPRGVAKHMLEDAVKGSRCVAVLRSQLCFGGDRPRKLNEFVETVIDKGKFTT
jgi:cell wall-associated NlpC family hydrolase